MDNIPARGAYPSPYDYRDNVAASGVAAALANISVPATHHVNVGPVLMQAKEPACVSNMGVELLSLWWFTKTGEWVEFSPRFLDALAKRFDGQDRATGGTYARLVMSLLAIYGCATTATVPNDTTLPVLEYRDDSILTPAAFAEAAKYKIPGYVQLPTDLKSTRAAVMLYGAVGTLMYIDEAWWTARDGTVSWADKDIDPLRTPNPNKAQDDGHATTVVGWTTDILNTDRNHWSDAWANKGEAAYDGNAWVPYIMEQWAISAIPADVADYLANLPAPSSFHHEWDVDMHYGDVSDDVKYAQIALMILGLLAPIPAGDLGYFGPKTAAANAAYQKANRITPSPNNIGPLTRLALNQQFAVGFLGDK